MEYKYKNPLNFGYKKGYLTKKQHNEIFKYRQIKWMHRYEYYYNNNGLEIHRFYTIPSLVLETILFPLSTLYAGLQNFKEHSTEFRDLWQQKKRGNFVGDSCPSSSEQYKLFLKYQNS